MHQLTKVEAGLIPCTKLRSFRIPDVMEKEVTATETNGK